MRIAVVQHLLRGDATADAAALADGVRKAEDAGAEIMLLPEIASLHDHPAREALFGSFGSRTAHLVSSVGFDTRGVWAPPVEIPGLEQLGRVALSVGDPAVDPEEIARYMDDPPAALLMSPRSESDLQAQAVLEYAVGLSETLCGLVAIAEPVGAAPGEPGHGGSAIVLLGEVLAEAGVGDDVLVVDVQTPIPRPDGRVMPGVPPILAQRLAVHRGVRPDPGYPAELT